MNEDTGALVPSGSVAVRPPAQLAAEIGKVMDLIAERLALETPHASTAARVRGARTVPREFVVSLAAAAERRPDLPVLGQFDSAKARSVLESADAMRVVAQRTAMLLASLNYTIEAQWANVVSDAMSTFSVAGIVAKRPQEAELAAEVENLRRQLGRKGRRKKTK
jgi:hypothetical protein